MEYFILPLKEMFLQEYETVSHLHGYSHISRTIQNQNERKAKGTFA